VRHRRSTAARRAAALGCSAALLLTGCAPVHERAEAATAVAVRLLTATASGDGATACATLAPDTLAKVAADQPCTEAILDADLPRPGAVVRTAVYGQWAQVKLTDDTIFLAVFPGGWRVVAAGCTPRGERPYDCTMTGG